MVMFSVCNRLSVGYDNRKKGRSAAYQFGLLLLLDDQRKLALTEMAGHSSEQYVF